MRARMFFRDGMRLGRVHVRWHAGVCSPERQTAVFRFEVFASTDGALLAFQVWRASIRLEVWW